MKSAVVMSLRCAALLALGALAKILTQRIGSGFLLRPLPRKIAKAFEEARAASGVSRSIVLCSARHTFATKVMGATGDLSLVMRALGHTNAQTAMIYQHPSLETVRSIVNDNPGPTQSRHNPRHTAVM